MCNPKPFGGVYARGVRGLDFAENEPYKVQRIAMKRITAAFYATKSGNEPYVIGFWNWRRKTE
jgi:hypothetical protein